MLKQFINDFFNINKNKQIYILGCGIRFPSGMKHSSAVSGSGTDGAPVLVQVFFTRNG